jgi:O-antigen ligase
MAKNAHVKSGRRWLFPVGIGLIDLAVQKGAADPLNPIKFWMLGTLALWALITLSTSRESLKLITSSKVMMAFGIFLSVFITLLFVAAMFTDVKSTGVLGDSGRNIGFLNYFFLAIISIYVSWKIKLEKIENIYFIVFGLSLLFCTYGFLQHFKIDFLKWNNLYNPIILTTGNPDFAASLLAVLVTIVATGLFFDFSKIMKFAILALIFLNFLIIYWTQARQGLIAAVLGMGILAVAYLWQRKKKLSLSLLTTELIFGFLAVLGALQVGPLTKLMFKDSITDRGYNWRAAIEMIKSHPLLGVGVDRFGAYFNQYRDPKYPLLYGYKQTVSNAHNVFLELFATAGVLVGLAYLVILIFVGFRAYVAIRSHSGMEKLVVSGIVASWIVFLAQSLISVDTITISIWGWVLSGAIVGLSLKANESLGDKSVARTVGDQSSSYRGLAYALLLIIFLTFIVVPMNRNETGYARFSQITSPSDPATKKIYEQIADHTFHGALMNPEYRFQVAFIMARNGYVSQATQYLKETIKADPRNMNSNTLLATIYEGTHDYEAAIKYRKLLQNLDPWNADNLLQLESDHLARKDMSSAMTSRDAIIKMAPGTDVAKRAAALITK